PRGNRRTVCRPCPPGVIRLMHTTRLMAANVLLLSCAMGQAAELKLLPADVMLTGPHATQRLIVVSEEQGQAVTDRTPDAKFTSSQPAVATVDERGVVRPVSDGEAVITATRGDRPATARVTVTN